MTDLAAAWAACPQITSVHASKDGRWVFWCWSGPSETDEVWCAPSDVSAPPARLTHGTDHFSIRDVSPDGVRLILAQSVNSNEHDHLLLLDRPSNRLTRLTPTQSTHYVYGGSFTPDGRAMVFIADHDFATGAATKGGWVWRQDLMTGERTCLARSDSPFERGVIFSPSGRQLLWHRHDREPGATQLHVMDADGTNGREVFGQGHEGDTNACWLDEERIALVAGHKTGDRLGILTLSTGRINWLTREPDLLPFTVLPGARGFACIAHRASQTYAVLCDPDPRAFPNPTGRRSLVPHAALPDGGWIAEAYDADAPHALIRLHPDGTATLIARAPTDTRRTYSTPHDFRWTAPDGTACQGWLYTPETASRGLIAYIHGGPTWHSEDWVNPGIGFLVQSGFTVLDPNYRGSTGFGGAYREAVKDDGWGGREQGDIRAGIEAVVAAGLAEPGHIGIAGNSYGGFSSWVAITRHADLVTAAIPMCGMYRLDIDYHETEMPHGRAYSEEMMGGTPEEFPEKYANASPGNFIDQIRGHLMIVHGMADSNVGPENTLTAIRELTAKGIPHQVMLFDDEGHGVARRGNLARYLAASEVFFGKAFAEGPRR
jgi:dipeptidyl aminopeptidase/acylaminoacyl peptidase